MWQVELQQKKERSGSGKMSDAQSNFLSFRSSLLISPARRSAKDVQLIYRHLREMQANSKLTESTVRAMAQNARYEVHNSNELLYTAEDWSFCWYILLSGSVFLDGCMYLPGSSFGKQSVQGKRGFDCLILEKSEMIVIDYPNERLFKPGQRKSYSMQDLETLLALDADEVKIRELTDEYLPPEEYREQQYASETGKQRLGSQSSNSSKRSNTFEDTNYDPQYDTHYDTHYDAHYDPHYGQERDIDIDLSGLKETMVDSVDSDDEDDISTASESATVRDIVRDCLEKDPSERTENDINILMDFVQHLPAFNKVTHNVRREMCAVMVFAVVEKAGSDVMIDGEEMDSWSVILNGSVEVTQKGKQPETMHLGDAFGVKTVPDKICHKGIMKTRVDDCQFVCIAREDYWRIFSQGEANTQKVEEEGEVVLVTEHRTTDGGSREGQVVIRGMPDRLLDHLMEDHSTIDPTYVEDYLLTYVIFHKKPHELASKLLKWFDRGQLKDKVTRVILLWVNNHYADFEGDRFMEGTLEKFERLLEARRMIGQLRLLNMARSIKSLTRTVTLDRHSKDTKLDFSILGGLEHDTGIFISKVDYGSKAEDAGLKKGDQILEINGQTFDNVKLQKAQDLLKSHAHLSLTVKHNKTGFKQLQDSVEKSKKFGNHDESFLGKAKFRQRAQLVTRSTSDRTERPKSYNEHIKPQNTSPVPTQRPSLPLNLTTEHASGTYPGRQNARIKKAMKIFIPKSGSNQELNKIGTETDTMPYGNTQKSHLKPVENDGNSNEYVSDGCQVIKVYRTIDQAFKYFIINKDTTAQEVVIESVEQFGITDTRGKPYFLCEVTATDDGVIRQKRLLNVATDLANRIGLSSRYYIKNNLSDGGVTTEIAQEIAREGTTTFLQLSPLDIARELTLTDFDLFRSIDSREYIYNLFDSKSDGKFTNLGKFEQTTNIEMFWVIREICGEINIMKRVKVIKRFIKIAKLCNDFKNYNSLFALLSGLDHSAVRRLKNTWEKVPAKYTKILEDLQLLMDPSRNMSRYRNLFNGERAYPPLIPFFPVIKKDLTFLHLGNETYVDGLVNFEKLRMIAKEVRKVCKYCAIGYDPGKMDDLSQTTNGAPPSIAQSVVSVMTGQNTLTRKNRRVSTGMSNPKKIYEETMTTRRMHQYLENLQNLNTNEDDVYKMSKICEPPAGSSLTSTLAARKKQSSTSPVSSKKIDPRERTKNIPSPLPSQKQPDATSDHSSSSQYSDSQPSSPSVNKPQEKYKTNTRQEKMREENRKYPTDSKLTKDNDTRSLQMPYPAFIDRPDLDDLEEQVSAV